MTIILNAGAGDKKKEAVAAQIRELCAQAGRVCTVHMAADGEALERHAREAVKGPNELIVAAGGDGTINAVANHVIRSGKIFGVIPQGTLNHFAKDLGVPTDLEGAVKTLIEGEVREIDVGEVNGRYFLNNSSIGLYPEIVRRRDKQQEVLNVGKWRAMWSAFIAALRRYRFVRVCVESGGARFQRTTPFVFVSNNEYNLDGFGIGGRKALDSGHLGLWVAHGTRPLGLLRLGMRAMFGMLKGARDFEAIKGAEFTVIPSRRLVRVSFDGEIAGMETPLRFRVHPRALKVMAPKPKE